MAKPEEAASAQGDRLGTEGFPPVRFGLPGAVGNRRIPPYVRDVNKRSGEVDTSVSDFPHGTGSRRADSVAHGDIQLTHLAMILAAAAT
jgi:hypothetical protein